MRKISTIWVFLFVFVLSGWAQTKLLGSLDRDTYLAKVKLVDEFMSRFNGEEVRADVTDEYKDRGSGIMLLLDLSKYESKNDSAFICAQEFAHKVISDSILLKFEDKTWYSKVHCLGKLNKKEVSFYMYLSVESKDSIIYSWVISDVEGDIFLTSRDKPHKELFIMPNDNELFFQSVKKITTETASFIDDYTKSSYRVDPLSVFLTLVRSNQLVIETIDDVELIFLQVPEYMFTIRYFNRENKNSGWLIDNICICDNDKKSIILKKLH